MSLYTHIPVTRTANPTNCKAWKGCHPKASETPQMTNDRIEFKTMRVVADISLVTDIPAKLPKAIETTVPLNAIPIKMAFSGTVFSFSIFNFAGISVTKEMSATTRMVLDSEQKLVNWGVSLAIGWQPFQALQLLGFAVLVTRM